MKPRSFLKLTFFQVEMSEKVGKAGAITSELSDVETLTLEGWDLTLPEADMSIKAQLTPSFVANRVIAA